MGTKQLANCRDYYFEKSMKVVFYIQGAWHFPKMVPTMFHSPAFLITCMTYHSPSIRHPLSSTWGLARQLCESECMCHKWAWICSVCRNHSPFLIHDIHCITRFAIRVARWVPQMEYKLLILPEHLTSLPIVVVFVLFMSSINRSSHDEFHVVMSTRITT
jgi:hypothetical protein